MSVLNRMLQDLAQREHRLVVDLEGVRAVPESRYAVSRRKVLYFVLLALVLTIAFVEAPRLLWTTPAEPHVAKTHSGTPYLAAESTRTESTPPARVSTRLASRLDHSIRVDARPSPASAPAASSTETVGAAAPLQLDRSLDAAPRTASSPTAATPNRQEIVGKKKPVAQKPTHPQETPAQREPGAEREAERYYRQGSAHLLRAEVAAAESEYRKALALNPSHHASREVLCTLLLDQGRLQEAEDMLAAGTQSAPAYPPYRRLLARILIARKQPEQALAVLEETPPSLAADPEYHALLAALYLRLQRGEQAANAYGELVQLRPDEGAWWAGLGASLEAKNEPAQALQAYTRAQQTGRLKGALLTFVNERSATLQH